MPALRGGVALVTTFVGLLITAWISSGLKITGASIWCWSHSRLAGCLVAVLILPVLLMKKAVEQRKT